MAMAVDRQLKRAFTASADHLVVRYDLSTLLDPTAPLQLARADQAPERVKSFSTGSIGNASIAVSHDGTVVAVGGWDGK
jgi:WD40 repeat protein